MVRGTSNTLPARPANEITNLNRWYQADNADLTIVSADGIHFKVHRVVLMLASSVFRDMLTVPCDNDKASTLSLSDNAIESGTSVKIFLDILYGHAPPEPKSVQAIAALRMLLKYDCTNAWRQILCAYESALLRSAGLSIYVFRVAAILDAVQTCQLAIRNIKASVWSTPTGIAGTSQGLEVDLASQPTLDIRAMSCAMMSDIPVKYSCALLRAHLLVDMKSTTKLTGREMTQKERDQFADEFVKLMA